MTGQEGRATSIDAAAARRDRFASSLRAVAFGILSNAGLIALKGVVGFLGHSQALIADAVHSAADLANSLAAFASLLVARRPADVSHPYGHGRAEALAAFFAALVIGGAGLLVIWEALQTLLLGRAEPPDLLTLWVALVAVAVKLVLAVYARGVARRVHSQAVSADARDHLTDVVATICVIAGILLARAGYPLFDPLAGIVVAGFIFWTAGHIFWEATHELMETSLDGVTRAGLVAQVSTVAGVRAVTGVAGRRLGDVTLIEVHIDVDPAMPVRDLGLVVDAIKQRLIDQAEGVTHVVVEANSGLDEPAGLNAGVYDR